MFCSGWNGLGRFFLLFFHSISFVLHFQVVVVVLEDYSFVSPGHYAPVPHVLAVVLVL